MRSTSTHSLQQWGKHWGLRRLADAQGLYCMVAIDQRPPLFALVAQARGLSQDQVAFDDVVAVKALLAQALAPHASALLVDPDFGLPAASSYLQPRCGLLLTLESHRYEDAPTGRRSRLIPNWSVEQIRRTGADAVKLLAWYRPDAAPEVCQAQQDWVAEVGRQCLAHDLPFVLELLTYPFAPSANLKSAAQYQEDPHKQARRVIESVRTFAHPRFAVDMFKLESPLPMAGLPDPEGAHGDAMAVQAMFDEMGAACEGRPWVMLSAGASLRQFERALRYACRAGASGFLAGRAVWSQALQGWPDLEQTRRDLQEQAVPALGGLREIVRRFARPCSPKVQFRGVTQEGDVSLARSVGPAAD